MKSIPASSPSFAWRRFSALVRKESLQVTRDPSTLLIACVLPVVLLFLYAYAVSLDIHRVPLGVVLESESSEAHELAAAFSGTPYFHVLPARDRREVDHALLSGAIRGYVVIPQDFEQRRAAGGSDGTLVQVITDGAQPNTANFVANYARGVVTQWEANRDGAAPPVIRLEPRFWFNPEIESRRALVPGAIAIVMTIIGTLLTAMVVARAWERGTMEAMMSTPAHGLEMIVGKLLPYYGLGMAATVGSALLTITVFDVPLRGSWAALLLTTSVFLLPALGQGLLISTLAKNQFIAAQFALLTGFLPAFLLSGFIFEIASMPTPIRLLTHLVPARYFVTSLQTIFLAGDVWPLLLPNLAALLALGGVYFAIVTLKTRKTLDS